MGARCLSALDQAWLVGDVGRYCYTSEDSQVGLSVVSLGVSQPPNRPHYRRPVAQYIVVRLHNLVNRSALPPTTRKNRNGNTGSCGCDFDHLGG
jgi:hypothetical protein